MKPPTRLLVAGALSVLAACAHDPPAPPGVSADLLAAQARLDSAGRVDLMRQQGERFAGRPFLAGNHAELLIDGTAAFAALAAAIKSAKRRIDMETYEFDATAGQQFDELLLAARARGVEVHVIYDAWGTFTTPTAVFDRLVQGGVRILKYNPLVPNGRVAPHLNERDHRKLLVVDGMTAITGGVNISRVYQNAPASPDSDPNDAAWRDTDVELSGPVVAQFDRFFVETWRGQKGPPIDDPLPSPPPFPDGVPAQAIDGAPDNGEPLIYRTLLAAITLAGTSVHLTTGFFVPTPHLMRALQEAARRGVDVVVIVPSQSTSDSAIAAGRAKYGDLLRAGVKIVEFQGKVLHAKTAIVDGAWSAVGSSNLDWRSTVWNNEIDAIVLGPQFGQRMEAVFRDDVAASTVVELAQWQHRGIVEHVKEWRAKLLEELL